MSKKRTHEFVIRVTFDKPCSAAHAIRETKDNIHGEFFTFQKEDTDPGSFKVKSFKHKAKS